MSDPIAAALQALVDAGELAGAATLVWRDGRVAQSAAVGWRDIEARQPMQRDTLFRIASMTKPVTAAAAMSLLQEGRFRLEDPIARWAPEFADMRVLRAPDGPLDDTVAAERAITFDDLLTHRSGLTYGDFHAGPIFPAYLQALGSPIDSAFSPDAWIARLAALPLIDQPGAGFHYGVSTDLLGLILARIEGVSLGEVLRRRIFAPLGMHDTGFAVPAEKTPRRAATHGFDAAGKLAKLSTFGPPPGAFLPERGPEISFESGGGGLWSTLDDYLAFARLFVEGGAVGGVRILEPQTLALMTANRLTGRQRAEARMLGMPVFAGHGFGLGLAVVMDPEKAPVTRCKGGVGTVGWPGAYGTWWQADPTDGSVLVFLTHNMVELAQIAQGIGVMGAYGGITQFHALAATAGAPA